MGIKNIYFITAYVKKMLIMWLNFCIKQMASIWNLCILKYIHNNHYVFLKGGGGVIIILASLDILS